jgi:AcrR family transcriptional regulator
LTNGESRERIVEAMTQVAAERGFEHVTVRLVSGRAGVSTRTFYEEFESLQDCFVAVLDLALERAGVLILEAFAGSQCWQDGVLGALASSLVFFDCEPVLARVWFVEAMAAGSWALWRREQIVERLRVMIVGYWAARGQEPPDPLAAMGVMASVLGLIQTHLVTERRGPLIELLGPLMGLVTSLHLDPRERAREIERGARLAREIQAGRSSIQAPGVGERGMVSVVVPAALRDARSHRLRLCLSYVVGHPGVSNKEIGDGIGVTHRGQLTKLLSKLAALGLVVKRANAAGHPNAWSATPAGARVARVLAGENGRPILRNNEDLYKKHLSLSEKFS